MIEKGDKLNLKTVYFIIDPRVYYIDKNNIENFFNDVDRSSSTTKLKAFIKSLNNYLYEVIFKYKTFQKNADLKSLYEIDYKRIDFVNLCVSLVINIILVLFLDKEDDLFSIVNIFIAVLSVLQILFNIYFLTIYFRSKYKYNVFFYESEYSDKEMNILDKIKVYILDSFILHDDVYLMILIMTMDILGLISDKFKFLYSLQLFSVVKFVETIKIIVMAFQTQILKLFSILGFLLIFIFFYANISYRFLQGEFNIEIEGGEEDNVCSSLLECTITYFNFGVRSGGGIGDLLAEVPYESGMLYWLRFCNDFLFFILAILILLNMIFGVIVSIFSEIREKANFKENDQNNKCFICNIDRAIFERLKIKFEDHKKFEHNIKTYIRFLIGVKLINEKDLDADQSFIINCLKKEEIKVFPVGVSSSTGVKKEDDSTEAEEEEEE
jgi:inositol 1,4,5-triphosphate receptor type 3